MLLRAGADSGAANAFRQSLTAQRKSGMVTAQIEGHVGHVFWTKRLEARSKKLVEVDASWSLHQ